MDEAIDVYVSDLSEIERDSLKQEVLNFLALGDDKIKSEFNIRYKNEFAPEDGKGLLLQVLKSIRRNQI
ncbi:hypothetical protein [Brenneria corticis]|uniref:CdiI immunity protein domain-containing protein n=1 Tax=Brenneria corticis TaxID=2173106 RepID=A0A2U1U436_9GAMM|nr:hypothetical protein [Brenneria sp. CFCC 11842]PWC16423.1 hypothetical protein DDT56_10135 [Brenneria sp. CFCC 11842]